MSPEPTTPTREQIARIVARHKNPVSDEFWTEMLESSKRRRASYPKLWNDDIEDALAAADAILDLLARSQDGRRG